MGRRSDKQVGALVHMHRRKVTGLGIILDRISKKDTVKLPESNEYGKPFRGGVWGWEARSDKGNSTFVLVQWFRKPSEYSDESCRHASAKAWYPISFLKVVSRGA